MRDTVCAEMARSCTNINATLPGRDHEDCQETADELSR
jgi:hypothetical protein